MQPERDTTGSSSDLLRIINEVNYVSASITLWSDPRNFSIIRRGAFQTTGVLYIENTGVAANGVHITWIAVGRWK